MKTAKTAEPTITHDRTPERTACAECGHRMTADYANRRTVHTLAGVTRLDLTIRRCHHVGCGSHKRPYRPEAEGSFALPRHEFGLDVVALIGRLRYAEHRSVPEIRAHLVGRHVSVCGRGRSPRRTWPGPIRTNGSVLVPSWRCGDSGGSNEGGSAGTRRNT